MTDELELLPCPFCDGVEDLCWSEDPATGQVCDVVCEQCTASAPFRQWQGRTIQPTVRMDREAIRPFAKISLWRDTYPDGPDVLTDYRLQGYFTPDQVRAARAFVNDERPKHCPNGLEHGSCLHPECVSSCPGRLTPATQQPNASGEA